MAKPLTDYLWIVDGHNLVLNVPELTRLHSHESVSYTHLTLPTN